MERKLHQSSIRKKFNKSIFNITLLFLFFLTVSLVAYSLRNANDVYAQENTSSDTISSIKIDSPLNEVNTHPFGLNSVVITSGENSYKLFTEVSVVSDLLEMLEITYDSDDIVIPSPDSTIAGGAKISVISITNERLEELVPIPFNIVYEEDPDLPVGEERILQTGSNGEELLTYTQKFEDGNFVSKTLISQEVLYNPIDQIVSKGTRREIPHSNLQSGTCDSWDAVIDNATGDEGERLWMKSIMRCESGCNANRVSYNGTYHGLFQFHPKTFAAYGGTNIYDGNQQIPIVLAWVRAGVQFTQFPGCTRGTR